MDTLPPQLLMIVLGVTLILGFLTALAKAASIDIGDARLEALTESGGKAKKLSELLKQPASVMDSLDLCCGFFVILFAVTAETAFYESTVKLLMCVGISAYCAAGAVAVIVIAAVIMFLYQMFWKLLPERLAAKYAEKTAVAMVGYTTFMSALGKPFLWLPVQLSNLIARMFGIHPHDMEDEVTEEEIRMMVDIGSENGTIDDDEKEMIHNIFELDDKPVEDIMTHRKEACILWMEDSLEEWKKTIDETKHTRYPVCGEDIDDVIGVVNTRDFYKFLLEGGQKGGVRTIFREPSFVPDSMKADELFSRMQRKNTHFVIVMDEYGGFCGLVTQEDLLEEIVGELSGEYDEPMPENDIERIDENTWKIKGAAEIEDVEEALGIKLPDGEYNTFAGLILDTIETLPDEGETVETEIGSMQIKVISITEHRIDEALVCLTEKEQEETESE